MGLCSADDSFYSSSCSMVLFIFIFFLLVSQAGSCSLLCGNRTCDTRAECESVGICVGDATVTQGPQLSIKLLF